MTDMTNSRNSKRVRGFSRLYIQAIFALAAALALSTSACGKQDAAKPVPEAAPAPTKAPAKTPGATDAVGRVVGTGSKELDKQSGTSASGKIGEPDESGEGTAPIDQGGGEPDPTKTKTSRSLLPVDGESVVYYDPTGLTPDQIFAKKANVENSGVYLGESVRSDIVSADGQALFYTGGGKDMLRTQLFAMVNERQAQLDEGTRAADKALAKSIQLSKFNVDWSSRRAELNFRFERMGRDGKLRISDVKISGPLDNFTRFQVGNVNKAPFLSAEVACMDITGDCKTVHVRVQDRSTGTTATAHLIARHTSATMYIGDGTRIGTSNNPEYERLMGVLYNTVKNPQGQNVVDQLTLTTSETIGGASNFAVRMHIRLQDQYGRRGGDVIEVTGPLAKPAASNSLDVYANVTPTFTVVDNEIVPTEAVGTMSRFVDALSEVHLLTNDGQGNLQLQLTVRSSTLDGASEKINLTFARIHTPTTPVRIPMQ